MTADRPRISGIEAGVAVASAEPTPDAGERDAVEEPPAADAGATELPGTAPAPADGPERPGRGGATDTSSPLVEVTSAHELPDWSDPPTMQVPKVLLDLDAASERPAASRAVTGGPVWKEHQGDWDDVDTSLADLADAGLGVAASEDSSADDPFAYDFLSGDPTGVRTSPSAGGEALREPAVFDAAAAGDGVPFDDPAAAVAATAGFEPDVPEADEQTAADAAVAPAAVPGGPVAEPPPSHVRRRAAHRAGRDRARGEPAGEHRHNGAGSSLAARIAAGPGAADREQRGRSPVVATITGVAVAALALGCFAAGPGALVALVAVLATLASAELFGALRTAGYRPATLVGLVATPVVVVTAYRSGPVAIALVTAVVVVATMAWFLFGIGRREPVVNLSVTVFAFCWIGVLGAFAGLLLDPRVYPDRHGVALLLGAAIAAVGYDVGGYAFGSWLGRHKLAPAISPNKTWEGLLGGSLLALVASVAIVSHIHPWTVTSALALGLVVAVVAPIGDLAESLVKRDLGVKDMGSILPAHGGVLDRVDALLFVLPATYVLVRLAHLG